MDPCPENPLRDGHTGMCLPAGRASRYLVVIASRRRRRGNLNVSKMNTRQYYVYILTNKDHRVLYIGVTNNLKRRVWEHREKLTIGFAERYNACQLVYYEVYDDISSAILREKQLKAGSRRDKLKLINEANSDWQDLYDGL